MLAWRAYSGRRGLWPRCLREMLEVAAHDVDQRAGIPGGRALVVGPQPHEETAGFIFQEERHHGPRDLERWPSGYPAGHLLIPEASDRGHHRSGDGLQVLGVRGSCGA